jgi:hypothetical protein
MKYLKVIVVLLLVFAAGISIGVVATRYVIKRDIRKAVLQPELVRLRIERELTRELSLTPAQQAQLDAILVKLQQDIAKARKERMPRIRPFFTTAQRSINDMLTPDQLEKFERYQAENGVFSFGAAQGQGQNFPRLQKLKKLRENMQQNQSQPPASTPAPAQPAPAPQPPPSSE